MFKDSKFKLLIINRLKENIAEKISSIKTEIESATDSRNNETKSSAGDKYETGRAMVQYELEKAQVQLGKTLWLEKELSKIDILKTHDQAMFGSLVITTQGNYFIAIAWGKIEVDEETIYCISLSSPVGKTLQNKCVGDKVNFQGNEICITQIL